MKTFYIATSNKGKQKEIERFAKLYSDNVTLLFPERSNALDVEESGSTFEENALIKVQAYQASIGDNSLHYVGDDSGVVIPALGGEPGVHTRRWAGYEMTDEEILRYCLDKMDGLKGDERKAIFKTVLAAVSPDGSTNYFRGEMPGRILEEPLKTEPQPGFPFRSIFWVDGIDLPIYKLHTLSADERKNFLSHREKAFKSLFSSEW